MKRRARHPFASSNEALLEIALICDAWHIRPSDYIGLKSEEARMDFDRAANYVFRIHQREKESMKIQDLLQGINLAVMLAYNGKPLEFKQEWETPIGEIPTFHSAGTSRKPRKSDVEIGADGKITDGRRAAW